jgi:hypothetical protein
MDSVNLAVHEDPQTPQIGMDSFRPESKSNAQTAATTSSSDTLAPPAPSRETTQTPSSAVSLHFDTEKRSQADSSSIDSAMYGSFEDWAQYIARKGTLEPVPRITYPRQLALIRWGFFTTYRRLFSLVFIGNMIALIIILTKHRNLHAVANAAAANLAVTGLIRLPHIVNIFYATFCSLPTSAPLVIRRAAADVSHFGGVHSGCGIAALCWYICLCGIVTRNYVIRDPPEIHDTGLLVLMYLILVVIMAIIISAYPMFRFKSHDTFEFTHRFSGWMLIALFWAFLIVFADKDAKAKNINLGHELTTFPSFWFAILLTAAFAIPWVTLRKVPVEPEYISSHAIRLHFTHTTTGFGQGIGVSLHPLKDWHNFAGIPNIDGSPGFSLIISKAGDWTGAAIKNQPRTLWKRGIPGSGFGHAILLFKRVVLITTGSGMGPCLSLLVSDKRPPTRILWQTKSPRATYGDRVLDMIASIDKNAVVIDSDKHGRQDMLPVAWDMVKESNAEAVFVVSRPWVVRKLVFEFEARGIPAFGPVFDS